MIDKIVEGAGDILDKFFPDADAESKRQVALQLAQLEINKVEAGHPSRFVAG